MSASSSSDTLVDWDEEAVKDWLGTIGYPQYQQQIVEHGISGDILSVLGHEELKEVGILSVGQRLAILKEVYHLKVTHGVTIEPEHYVPPSEAVENAVQEGLTVDRLREMFGELKERVRLLEEENRKLNEGLHVCLEELMSNRPISKPHSMLQQESSLRKQPSFKWANYDRPVISPTRPAPDPPHDSPRSSPQALEHDTSGPQNAKRSDTANSSHHQTTNAPSRLAHERSTTSINQASTSRTSPPSHEVSRETTPSVAPAPDNQFKSFKVSLDDPCWKVLPAALKKYKISDDWRQYVMFICYGSTERCLSYDEKPLLLFQKLKDANKNPVFMLRHIKDIRSPIALAQQKQMQRIRDGGGTAGPSRTATNGNSSGLAPPAYSRNTRLHHAPVLQPISAHAQAFKANAPVTANGQPQWPETAAVDAQHDASRLKQHVSDDQAAHPDVKDGLAASAGGSVSYAIAIYPYMAEQDDEFDVVVDDTYIILSRTKGWWVVQRDVDGTGSVDDSTKGWVPAGCLLETGVPPATAVSEAKSNGGTRSPEGSASLAHKAPILPSNIISTSFPGIALMNYVSKGDHELDLTRSDVLRVFKRYNHWSYAIKEDTGNRGWVPSWFVGKYVPGTAVPSSSIVPPTPTSGSTNGSHTHPGGSDSDMLDATSSGDRSFTSGGLIGGSPLSPAFPSSHAKVPPI